MTWRTWRDLKGLGSTWNDLKSHEKTEKDLKWLERWEYDNQTENANPREAYTSKNVWTLIVLNHCVLLHKTNIEVIHGLNAGKGNYFKVYAFQSIKE